MPQFSCHSSITILPFLLIHLPANLQPFDAPAEYDGLLSPILVMMESGSRRRRERRPRERVKGVDGQHASIQFAMRHVILAYLYGKFT